ncbi:ral guanine nucleotide dissociation stimulator-like 3 [Tiliqua scincoides]|uniref:ral guanine nucleotide dissociation stimulator-like 3 n=1 Tax=Tiliqua scincoides TaxID=71010 RepID=UPI0034636059
MSKAEIAMTPLQHWGEEVEDGAIYSITLQRVRAEPMANRSCHLDSPNPPECPFVQYRTCKRRTLRAATLPRLVKWLVSATEEGDLSYIPSFLATYRTFTTAEQVLEMLLPLGPDNCRSVLHVLECWLQDHSEDFWEPPEHSSLHRTLHFLRQSAPDSPACVLAEGLLQAHKEKQEKDRGGAAEANGRMVFSYCCAGGESPRMVQSQAMGEATGEHDCEETPALLSFSVDEVAQQLTLMDADLFRAVRPFDCLGCVWSQRDKKENQHVAPSVRATVAQFNAVTGCVIASVLGDLTLRTPQRAQLLEKWINIAQRCRALRNFSSLHAILSALQSNSIYRLKRTWAAVNRDIRGTFRKLSQIFSEDNNHLNCREILLQEGGNQGTCDGYSTPETPARISLTQESQARLVAPTIPYLGTFLTDLIMLDTALLDFVEGNLINFEKRRKEAAILSWIRQLQDSCQGYNLCPNPSFHLSFQQHQQLSEEQSYRISRVIEPPADSCPNSPKLHRSLTKRFSSLLLGSEASATPPGPDKIGISPLGSCSSLNSENSSSTPCSPICGTPTCKDLPVFQQGIWPLTEPPLPSPVSKQGGTESRIIRVSMDNALGNLYRSIVITSQDKTTAVVQRALQKHNLEGASLQNYQLLQLLGDGQELLIPDSANTFYAMSPAGPCDFLLRHKEGAPNPSSLRTTQPRSKATLQILSYIKYTEEEMK